MCSPYWLKNFQVMSPLKKNTLLSQRYACFIFTFLIFDKLCKSYIHYFADLLAICHRPHFENHWCDNTTVSHICSSFIDVTCRYHWARCITTTCSFITCIWNHCKSLRIKESTKWLNSKTLKFNLEWIWNNLDRTKCELFNSVVKVDDSKVKYPSQEHAQRCIVTFHCRQTNKHRARARYYHSEQFEKYVTLNHCKRHVFLRTKFGKKVMVLLTSKIMAWLSSRLNTESQLCWVMNESSQSI